MLCYTNKIVNDFLKIKQHYFHIIIIILLCNISSTGATEEIISLLLNGVVCEEHTHTNTHTVKSPEFCSLATLTNSHDAT